MTLPASLTMLVFAAVCVWPSAGRAHDGRIQSRADPARVTRAASVWDGVYAIPQAKRGAALADRCRTCHGYDLEGGIAPALIGREFAARWDGRTLSDLFERIAVNFEPPDRRPANAAGGSEVRRLSVDFLAYLLIANGFPAGHAELADGTETLKALRILATKP